MPRALYYNMGKERKSSKRSHERNRSRSRDKHIRKHRERSYSSEQRRQRKQKHRQHHREHRSRDQPVREEKPAQQKEVEKIVKQLPCWQPSGILLEFYNSREGVSLKFHEPPEARKPIDNWKVYVFKGDEVQEPIQLTSSCYLIGKDERVCDILTLNPSISRQHAVIQFRMISKMNTLGDYSETIKPYILDLASTNGTFLNDEKVEPSRYVQLLHKDVLRFGFSDRLYVLVKDEEVKQPTRAYQEEE